MYSMRAPEGSGTPACTKQSVYRIPDLLQTRTLAATPVPVRVRWYSSIDPKSAAMSVRTEESEVPHAGTRPVMANEPAVSCCASPADAETETRIAITRRVVGFETIHVSISPSLWVGARADLPDALRIAPERPYRGSSRRTSPASGTPGAAGRRDGKGGEITTPPKAGVYRRRERGLLDRLARLPDPGTTSRRRRASGSADSCAGDRSSDRSIASLGRGSTGS